MDKNTIYNLISHYESVSFSLYQCHKRQAKKNLYYANIYNLFTILITAFTGTSSVSLLFQEFIILKTTNVIFSYMVVVIGMLQKSYNPIKRYENHKLASESYISLYYQIKEFITFNEIIEDELIKKWIMDINNKMEEYRKKYPYINDIIYDNVKRDYIQSKNKNIYDSENDNESNKI